MTNWSTTEKQRKFNRDILIEEQKACFMEKRENLRNETKHNKHRNFKKKLTRSARTLINIIQKTQQLLNVLNLVLR